MPGTPTPNYGLYIGTISGDSGVWGGDVNANLTTYLDSFLGNTLGVTMTSSNVTLTLSQWQNNGVFKITGTLTANVQLILPFNGSTGATTAVGGKFVVDNETTGAFTITVLTVASGSTGVTVAQGTRTSLYSDQTNVWYADDSRTARLNTNAGNPNGSVSGNAGSVNQPADVIWDRTNGVLYVSTGSTNWSTVGPSSGPPQGYLTATSLVPIIASDVMGGGSIYYTPYRGNLSPISSNGGTSFAMYSAGELPIGLSGTSGGDIRDIFAFLNAGVVAVGWGPAWASGVVVGSMTAGACARGTGTGSTALARTAGYLTNANAIVLNNPTSFGTSSSIPPGQATYLGSISIDATPGQLSCYRSYKGGGVGGTPSKWGIWNCYNRTPIKLQGGSSTASWLYGLNAWRQSNADVNCAIVGFTGLPEEELEIEFRQLVNLTRGTASIGIGINSTTSPSGMAPTNVLVTNAVLMARYIQLPQLSSVSGQAGTTSVNMLENSEQGSGNQTFNGTINNMLMTVTYNG